MKATCPFIACSKRGCWALKRSVITRKYAYRTPIDLYYHKYALLFCIVEELLERIETYLQYDIIFHLHIEQYQRYTDRFGPQM